MKIIVERDVLADVVQGALRAVNGRSALPILAGVRIEAVAGTVEVAGTDLGVFVSTRGSAAVEEPGVVVVFGRLLGEIVRSLPPGPVTVTAGDGRAVIRSVHVAFSLATLPAEDFPVVPAAVEGPTCRLAAGDLAWALATVVPAACPDQARPVLAGVLWSLDGETLRLVATDSYRLAIAEVVVKEGPGDGEMIVPARALAEFGRFLAKATADELAAVTIGDQQAVLEAGAMRIVARLIEGNYPDWRQLIPGASPNRLVVDRGRLCEALGRVGLLAKANIPVRLELGGELGISARATGVGEAAESIEVVSYDGEPMTVGFNPRYLTAGLDAMADEHVTVGLVDPSRPAVLAGESAAFTYLVMPVRLWDKPPPPMVARR